MKRNSFVENVCWFSGFAETHSYLFFRPPVTFHPSLHCLTSEHFLYPYLCALHNSRSIHTSWNLSLSSAVRQPGMSLFSMMRNTDISVWWETKHSSNVFLTPTDDKKLKGKDFSMPTAKSSASFSTAPSLCSPSAAASPERYTILVNSSSYTSFWFIQWFSEHSLRHLLGTCLKKTYSSIKTPFRGLFVATKLLASVLLWPALLLICLAVSAGALMLSACGILQKYSFPSKSLFA